MPVCCANLSVMFRRLTAVVALISLIVAAVVTVVELASAVLVLILALLAVVIVGVGGWYVVTTHGPRRGVPWDRLATVC